MKKSLLILSSLTLNVLAVVAQTTGLVTDVCGNTYNYVKIGNQYWMAENMKCNKYDTKSERAGVTLSTSSGTTYSPYYTDGRNATTSYSGSLTNEQRTKLGLLYNWAAAVGLANESAAQSQTSSFSGNRQGICPNGWHIPTNAEWETLAKSVGGVADATGSNYKYAGNKLKTTSGWYNSGNGTNDNGFSVLPAGAAGGANVERVGAFADFWTATPYNKNIAVGRNVYYYDNFFYINNGNTKNYARSVRCVSDKDIYTIRFVNDNGSVLQSKALSYGETPKYTGSTPTKASTAQYSYTFSGWSPSIANVTKALDYKAQFKASVRSYTIQFVNGTTVLECKSVTYGTVPAYTGATPTKPSDSEYTYTFTGWDNEIEPVTEDKTYAVVFKAVSNGTIRDICGNAYHYVKIGNQVWLAENMKCNKYDTESERAGATLSAYGESSYYTPYYADGRNTTTSYSGNLTNEQKAQLGLLYNWAAAVGYATEAEAKIDTYEYNGFRQGICPNGWHIPTTTEWEELVKTIGGESIAGSKLKTTSGWYEDGNGRDLYGFASLPAGFAGGTNIKEIGGVTSYWTDKPHSVNETYLRFTNYTDANLFDSHSSKENARSVRCLKNRYVSISFLNYDGNELQNSEVEYGATPVYTGATPTKPSDAEYTYTFTGWDNEIEPVTEDKTYTAVFKVVSNGAVSDICGNTYRYVKIGNQVWLAENMKCNKYDTESEQAGVTLPTSNSTTYAPYYTNGRNTTTSYSGNLTDAQREKLGFLYNWAAVVGLSSASEAKEQTTAFGGTRQGICPNGWHVPSETEWNELAETLGGSADSGKKLKTTSGWYDNGNGTDLYGFEALPAGYGNAYSVLNVGYGAYFWTATPYDEEFARNKYFNYTMDNLGSANISKWYVRSVRCVKTKYAEIIFLNDDGTELQISEVEYGATPVYTGATPYKPSDSEEYKYVFSGWDSEIVPATEDKVYTATFIKRPVYKNGVLNGEFSVGENKKVHFSQGNLQYNAALGTHQCADGTTQQGTWRFAENQWDYVGDATRGTVYENGIKCDNSLISSTYNGWIDLFGWGTSGWDSGANAFQSFSTSNNQADYYPGGDYNTDLQGLYAYSDWGVYNAIANGGDMPNLWYTLSDVEWKYLFNTRENAENLRGNATVNGIHCYLILPDLWSLPQGLTFTPGTNSWDKNVYSLVEWFQMEDAGAVLVSNALRRVGSTQFDPTIAYWSSSHSVDQPAKSALGIAKETTYEAGLNFSRSVGHSVRLVQRVKYEVKFVNYDSEELQSEELEYGETPVYKGSTPVKPADAQYTYTFNGWEPEITEVIGPQTYTAQFSSTTNKYTIRFLNDNGEVLQSESLDYGATPEYKGSEPTKPATAQYTYTFNGWDKTITTVTEATDYTATYSSTVNMYEIKFVNYNGDELQSEELEYGVTPVYKGQTPVKPADAQYTYTFSGWSPEIVEVTEAKTYTAQFSNTTNKYTIRFLNDNGEVLQSESLYYGATPEYKGSTPTKPTTAQYTYTFAGWDKTITTVTEATDYTATYNSVVNKYEIKFVNYDGEELQSEELDYGATPEYKGQTPVKPADAQYTYIFIGWSPEIAEVTEAKTYTAQFSSTTNKYTIRFLNDDGDVLQSESLDYGATPEYKGLEPTKPATAQYTYTFNGWDKAITTVTEATDYTATYSSVVNKYEIKFVNYDGEELQSEELDYGATPKYKGQTPVKPADAQYTYTFSGWEPEIAEVTEPKTYTAQFSSTTNKYTVKTIAQTEGVTTGDGLYDYGETATLTATPNEGYEFTGWSNGKTSATIEIVVTKDTTLTAYFQFKPCTVEKDIEVSVPEGGTITLKSGKTITVTKSQRIDDLKVTPLKCDSLFHYNITMIRQSADNTPACDKAPSVAKYDWLFMINVKALNAQGYAFGEGNVSWYRIVGEMDNIDDPASMHTDQLVGKGYGYTIDKSFVGTGDYYALIDLPKQTSEVGCKGIMRTQVFRYGASKRSAPAVIPTIAYPNQRMQVMHLPQEENCEIYVYDNVGKLCRHFASHGADTAEFEAEMRQGSYIVVIKSADGTESVKYIVK
jgi:uncharacterized protein (TIGR02145 family)